VLSSASAISCAPSTRAPEIVAISEVIAISHKSFYLKWEAQKYRLDNCAIECRYATSILLHTNLKWAAAFAK
jgi:type IV secretory pathway TrbF-like protein